MKYYIDLDSKWLIDRHLTNSKINAQKEIGRVGLIAVGHSQIMAIIKKDKKAISDLVEKKLGTNIKSLRFYVYDNNRLHCFVHPRLKIEIHGVNGFDLMFSIEKQLKKKYNCDFVIDKEM